MSTQSQRCVPRTSSPSLSQLPPQFVPVFLCELFARVKHQRFPRRLGYLHPSYVGSLGHNSTFSGTGGVPSRNLLPLCIIISNPFFSVTFTSSAAKIFMFASV